MLAAGYYSNTLVIFDVSLKRANIFPNLTYNLKIWVANERLYIEAFRKLEVRVRYGIA
jgi:hypothetical protein